MKKYSDPMDDILDRPIAYNPALKRITGSTNAAILLSQAWYWTKRTKDPAGWFYKTRDEWNEETALTLDELDGARKICRELGVIDEQLKGVPATIHYRVNKQKIYILLGVQIPEFPESGLPGNSQIPEKQESDGTGIFNKESENTTGNTTEEEDFGKVWTFYQNNFHMGGTHDHEKVGDLFDEHGGHWTLQAMKIAVENNKRNIAYFSKILERWKADGYGTTKPENQNGNGYKHVDHPGPDIPLVRATEPETPVISLDALRQARVAYEKDKAS